jgi:uncharacterized protein (DUF488 family)
MLCHPNQLSINPYVVDLGSHIIITQSSVPRIHQHIAIAPSLSSFFLNQGGWAYLHLCDIAYAARRPTADGHACL